MFITKPPLNYPLNSCWLVYRILTILAANFLDKITGTPGCLANLNLSTVSDHQMRNLPVSLARLKMTVSKSQQ
jgi:hypothetical protein